MQVSPIPEAWQFNLIRASWHTPTGMTSTKTTLTSPFQAWTEASYKSLSTLPYAGQTAWLLTCQATGQPFFERISEVFFGKNRVLEFVRAMRKFFPKLWQVWGKAKIREQGLTNMKISVWFALYFRFLIALS